MHIVTTLLHPLHYIVTLYLKLPE